jgi:hypothetical protein
MDYIRLMGREVMPALQGVGDELGLQSPFRRQTPVSLAQVPTASATPLRRERQEIKKRYGTPCDVAADREVGDCRNRGARQFVAAMDISIVNVAMPKMIGTFGYRWTSSPGWLWL